MDPMHGEQATDIGIKVHMLILSYREPVAKIHVPQTPPQPVLLSASR